MLKLSTVTLSHSTLAPAANLSADHLELPSVNVTSTNLSVMPLLVVNNVPLSVPAYLNVTLLNSTTALLLIVIPFCGEC